jgi:hypothetical protein
MKHSWDHSAYFKIEVPEKYKAVVEELQQEITILLKDNVIAAENERGYQSRNEKYLPCRSLAIK